MNALLTPEQEKLKNRIAEFARKELNSDLPQRDRDRIFDRSGWLKCAEMGIQGMPIPLRYGGQELDPLSCLWALEGLGYGCEDNGLCFALNAHLWGCAFPICAFGTDDQKIRLLPDLCGGKKIGALAVSEREAGSDAYSLSTRAERRSDGYTLNGHKLFVTNGPVADVTVVLATLDRSKGAGAITAFLVERGMRGVHTGSAIDKMGLHTAQMSEMLLEDCQVPLENRLGAEGSGPAIFSQAMDWERGFILASAIGGMQRQLERCLDYMKKRRQFGQPIGSFQLMSSKVVDMHMRLETGRLLLYKAALLKCEGRASIMETAVGKLYVSDAWVQSCQDALQIHGGYGYLTETGLERDLRDALAARLYSGTSEIQRQIIAKWLGAA